MANTVRLLFPLALVAAAFVWSCWPTLLTFAEVWSKNPQYSHGFLVPGFSMFLLWHRRALLDPTHRDRAWVGFLILIAGCALKLAGGYYTFAWPERASVVVIIPGLVVALGGWQALRWAWPAIAFLAFMVPMPGQAETLLAGPMQRVAAVVSVNVLQTLGFFAQADGTVIILSDVDLAIVEACSGLRMFLAFVALSTAVALVIDRPVWQRAAVILGAGPVALVCNVGRIVVTAVVHEAAGKQWADLVFHDLAGWLMMPAGLALLWLELQFLGRVVRVEPAVALPSPPVPSQPRAGRGPHGRPNLRVQVGSPGPS